MKNSKAIKSTIAFLLCVVTLLCAMPFSASAETATDGCYSYMVTDGKATITNVNSSISGDVTIPSTLGGYPVTSIGDSAFYYCKSLESITIPDSVTSIGYEAFYYCKSLESVTIGNSVTSIGNSAFYSCDKLASITIPDSVTSIGEEAFYYCKSLESITIPDSVTSIGYEAFYYCKSLESVTIGNGVTSIGGSAFYDCTSLESITIPDSVTSIDNYAFSSCDSLTSITIPDSVTSIGKSAFNGTAYYNNESNWENDVLYIGNHLIAVNDSVSGSYSVKEGTKTIAGGAFSFTEITSITIPDSVTSIGDEAFSYCESLESITVDKNNPNYSSDEYGVLFNKNKTELIQYPIGNQRTAYSIPNSVTSIDNYAFLNCNKITSITIPDSVTSIGDGAFYSCYRLTSITIPDSVTSIGLFAFIDNAYFNDESNWENGALYIGNHLIAFNDSVSGSYSVKEGTKTIAGGAFYNCTNLISITLPDSVTSIGMWAFYECQALESITLPDSVTSIGNSAFIRCENLKSLTMGNGLVTIDDLAFFNCSNLTSITIPDSVTSIGYGAFSATGITSIIIPESVMNLGYGAFVGCNNLKIVIIPKSLKKIEMGMFGYCTSLTDVYYGGSEADWKKVEIGYKNEELLSATIHFYYNGLDNKFTVADTNDTVKVSYDKEAFDADVEEVKLVSQPVTPATDRYDRNGFYNKNMLNPISVLDVKIVDQSGNSLQPKDGKTITISIKAPQEFNDLIESAIRANAAFKDARLSNISFADGVFSFNSNGVRKTLEASKSFLNSFKIIHWFSDGTNPGDYEAFTHSDITIKNGDIILQTGHFSDFAICLTTNASSDAPFAIAQPSRTSISYGDSIVLHADTANIPAGGYVKWTADNGNFTYTASSDGTTCTVTPKKSGSTTFTATVCDGEGNAIESATQQMTAKAGFFDKIIAFFKNLFGLTKVYPQMLGLEVK